MKTNWKQANNWKYCGVNLEIQKWVQAVLDNLIGIRNINPQTIYRLNQDLIYIYAKFIVFYRMLQD